MKEAFIMTCFDHKHVMALLGVCYDEHGMPMLVLPLMAKGDLHSYIKDTQKVSQTSYYKHKYVKVPVRRVHFSLDFVRTRSNTLHFAH